MPPGPADDAVDLRAAALVAVLVAGALVAGAVLGVRARPAPPAPLPEPAPTVSPSPTPLDPAEVERRAFAQPISSGCATGKAVWLFSDGGAAIRFDGTWSIPDATLRSLEAAACRPNGIALAVGGAGSALTVDDELRTLRVDRVGIEDLHGVAFFPRDSGAIAVGSRATVLRQDQLDWAPIPPDGATEDLYGIALSPGPLGLPGVVDAWAVGASGAAYSLTSHGWQKTATGTTAALRAVLLNGQSAIAVGDGGTALRFAPATGWTRIETRTDADLRALAFVGSSTIRVVGARGTVLDISGDTVSRIDLGTTCTLRTVFVEGPGSSWIAGSDGARGAAWRLTPSGVDRWGSC